MAERDETSKLSRDGQLGLGVGLTSELALFDEKEAVHPEDRQKGKHQLPPQATSGTWQSVYES
jgi:hypothetical protein